MPNQTNDPTNPAYHMITTLTSETPSATFGLGILTIPDATTREDWRDLHRSILLARASAGRWLRQSRDWASDRFGVEFVAESEVQLEFELGMSLPEEKPTLNPNDKTRGILTIEGICSKFELWKRKMSEEFPKWDREQLEKAVELLEPIERQAKELRQILESKTF
jgi:hypothetical protein